MNENTNVNVPENSTYEKGGVRTLKSYYHNVIIAILLIMLLVGTIFVFNKKNISESTTQALPHGVISKFDFKNDLPDSFFTKLPFVKKSKVLESYRIKYANHIELTVTLVSDKTPKDVFFSQLGFLKQNNWVIDKTTITKDAMILHAIYMNDRLDVSVSSSTSPEKIGSNIKITLTNY